MNNINRHNYETFFLLYADNELSAAEKMTVDEFVDANPDLQEELVMLQQSILKPDNIVFDDKNSLLRNEFTPTRLQELLLLHLDNELTETERDETGGLIRADADVKNEWDILKQTKLMPASAVVYKDKRLLYRKETGRIVAFPWWRVAAAAAFIGFVIWGGLEYFNNGTIRENTGISVKTPAKPTVETAKQGTQQTNAPVESSSKDLEVATTRLNVKKASPVPASRPHEKALRKLTGRDDQSPVVIEKSNNLPKPNSDNLNKINGNETIPAYVTNETQIPGKTDPGKNIDKQDPVNTIAIKTSYTENPEENNNRILFMGEEKVRKSKLGGIFRKVKRVLERNANIKPGENNIKVANLEFAIQ